MNTPVTLRDLLLKGTGRAHTDMLCEALEQNPALFDELVSIYLANEDPASRKAAWAVDLYLERHPECMQHYIEDMVLLLEHPSHDAIKRHTLRMLMRLPLPVRELGTLMNICFGWLVSPREPVAPKVYSMEILYRLALIYPELRNELSATINMLQQEGTAGLVARGRQILKKLAGL